MQLLQQTGGLLAVVGTLFIQTTSAQVGDDSTISVIYPNYKYADLTTTNTSTPVFTNSTRPPLSNGTRPYNSTLLPFNGTNSTNSTRTRSITSTNRPVTLTGTGMVTKTIPTASSSTTSVSRQYGAPPPPAYKAASKRQNPAPKDFLPVTGAKVKEGETVPVRLEIRELEKDATAWTLYLLGLDMMQATNQTEKDSWYQIAGIHGRPFLPWDNVAAKPGNEDRGYCEHVSVLFPTWHRPYLALYEQVLQGMIVDIALRYPKGPVQDKYVAAAEKFRIPFWDFAALQDEGTSVLPTSVGGSPFVEVDGPNGVQRIANPLFSYRFKPLDKNLFPDAPYNVQPTTLRYPTSTNASAISRNNLVAQHLDKNAPSFRSRLYTLFTAYGNYSTFSNEAWIPAELDGDFDSIESLHDQVHGLIGTGGHMSVIGYSAFDPLFMLHHTMVDRSFAMWQAMYPNSYVEPTASRYGSFVISPGDIQTRTTSLAPFRDTTGEFWTSDTVRDTETFGYAYPETTKTPGANVTAQVIAAVNKLYGPRTTNGTEGVKTRDIAPGQFREWIANIKVKKHALSGTFFVHIFLGKFSAQVSEWSLDPNNVGTHCIFDKVNSTASSLPSDQTITGTIPLTGELTKKIKAGELKSLEAADVEPYLEKNMKYRISLLDDTEVGNGDVPSLKVSVISAPVEKAKNDDDLPKWGQTAGHLDISTT